MTPKSRPKGASEMTHSLLETPPPGKVPIVDSKQHPGEYNIRPASDYIWTAPWPQFWPEKFWHQINLTPIFHIFLKIYWKLLSSFFIILNFFSYPHKYIENFSYVFKYKILNFTLISKNNSNCHNPNSTTKQPQLNSTELGLTWLWLCTPAHQPTTHHQNFTSITSSLRTRKTKTTSTTSSSTYSHVKNVKNVLC